MKAIKIIIFLLHMILYSTGLYCQYLNNPESAVYDSINNRYLISNFGNGNIVQIDSMGTQSIYLSNVQSSGGLHIVDSVLYMVCGVNGIKGYDLITGENVFNVTISGFPNINDITSDNFGNLYVSFPAGNAIYKINIASGQSWVFTNQGLLVPNGLFCDEENNRLLLVSYRPNSPIQAVSLIDSTVSLVTYTGKHNLDGLTRDAEGNYYFSSWQTNSVYVIDGEFLNSPELFSSHNDDPADIYFDIENNLIPLNIRVQEYLPIGIEVIDVFPAFTNGFDTWELHLGKGESINITERLQLLEGTFAHPLELRISYNVNGKWVEADILYIYLPIGGEDE